MRFSELEKLSLSPSQSLLVWVGSFIAGIIAVTLVFSDAVYVWTASIAFGALVTAAVCGFLIKKGNTQLFSVAALLFTAGAARYLSTAGDPVNLLSYLPALLALKAWLVAAVGQLLPEPHAGFMNGLLVGGGVRSSELKAVFIATGTAHVMALSGWNISLISRWMEKALVFFRFQKTVRWVVTTVLVVLFVIMTGASASLVRAAAMAVLVVIAAAGGRRSAPGRAVIYAAAAMLFVSPRIMTADIGFLLSVAATLGLVYLAPFFKPFADLFPDRFEIRGMIAGTIGATLGTLPIALAAFGQTSLVALPANLLLLPFIAPTMFVGFAGVLLASAIKPLGGICAWAASLFTTYDISVVRLFSRVPGASITGLNFNLMAAVLMAAGMIVMVIRHYDDIVQKKI